MTDAYQAGLPAEETFTPEADPYAGFAFGAVEMQAEVQGREDRGRKDRDARICMCGHTGRAHKLYEGFTHTVCRVGKVVCNCESYDPILKPGDARMFMRATEGPGPKHALSLGIERSREEGKGIEWLAERKCAVCAVQVNLLPVPMDNAGTVLARSGQINKFLCLEHFELAKQGGVGLAFQNWQSRGGQVGDF